jgi:hypothetical protein
MRIQSLNILQTYRYCTSTSTIRNTIIELIRIIRNTEEQQRNTSGRAHQNHPNYILL